MPLRSINDLDTNGQRGIVRLDLNVPLQDGKITDDTRIRAALPTINLLIEQGASIVVCSHLGRPKGQKNPEFSLEPVGARLAELLGREVVLFSDYIGASIPGFAKQHPGKIVLLENLRFYPEEEKGTADFAKELAEGFDFYVNDAFGCAHRPHASMTALAECFAPQQRAAGLLLNREIEVLTRIKDKPENPFTVIMGGAKVSDKIGVILNLLQTANNLIIGGAMAYSFLKYRGIDVGKSRIEADKMDLIEKIYQNAEARKVRIELPVDHIAAASFDEEAQPVVVAEGESIADNLMGLDIGPKTAKNYRSIIAGSRTVLWNGPMGVFEWDAFAKGTLDIAHATAETGAMTVVGGGDSVAAVNKAGVAASMGHISTGGGASLEFLEGKTLPGVKPLIYSK